MLCEIAADTDEFSDDKLLTGNTDDNDNIILSLNRIVLDEYKTVS